MDSAFHTCCTCHTFFWCPAVVAFQQPGVTVNSSATLSCKCNELYQKQSNTIVVLHTCSAHCHAIAQELLARRPTLTIDLSVCDGNIELCSPWGSYDGYGVARPHEIKPAVVDRPAHRPRQALTPILRRKRSIPVVAPASSAVQPPPTSQSRFNAYDTDMQSSCELPTTPTATDGWTKDVLPKLTRVRLSS
jgi:hypothetical protein